MRVDIQAAEHSFAFELKDGGHVLYLKREHRHTAPRVQVDAWGSFWSLAWGHLEPGQATAVRGDEQVPVHGTGYIFLPPFSLVEWKIETKPLAFEVFFSKVALPQGLPKEGTFFRTDSVQAPQSAREAIALIQGLQVGIPIGREKNPAPNAARLKAHIDKNFRLNKRIRDFAQELDLNHSVMTRQFQASYGLSPVEYRNKMRVNESMSMMLIEKTNVMHAAKQVGYEEVSRFQKNFRREKDAPPSKFRF